MTTQTTKKYVFKSERYDHNKVCHKAALAVPKETRQKFINGIWHGMTIGECMKELDINLEAAMGIMNMNLVRETTMRLNLVSE